jgi:hypothetical protein
LDSFTAPRITTHCLYGVGIPTEIKYNYTRGINRQPTIHYDSDGDGTIPAVSLHRFIIRSSSYFHHSHSLHPSAIVETMFAMEF